jgi:hypothetical protein
MTAMTASTRMNPSRRDMLRWAALAASAGVICGGLGTRTRAARAQSADDPRFLFVVGASGGASIIDSFLPVVDSEVSSASLARSLVAYPAAAVAQPSGSNIRCVKNVGSGSIFTTDYDIEQFLTKHVNDMAVVTVENTSVNHVVAQKRAITGAGIDGGRTIQEAMAMRHGEAALIPNANMASGAYAEAGAADVPDRARAELIGSALTFPLTMDGIRGVDGAPARDKVALARARRGELEQASGFGARFEASALRRRYLQTQAEVQPALEGGDLITKLMMVQEGMAPLAEHDLQSSPEAAALAAVFPRLLEDRLQVQAALAFLLARYGVSAAITLGPSFDPNFYSDGTIVDTPLAFDYSHNDHINAQQVMWARLCETLDGLITLLQGVELGGGSMWDKSLIYVATDFGRTKTRPSGATAFGSGHDLNNGNLFLSPLLKGNRVYGGVDPDSCKTYGFDLATGEPDAGTVMREGHLYSLIACAMDIDFEGRHDMSALLA